MQEEGAFLYGRGFSFRPERELEEGARATWDGDRTESLRVVCSDAASGCLDGRLYGQLGKYIRGPGSDSGRAWCDACRSRYGGDDIPGLYSEPAFRGIFRCGGGCDYGSFILTAACESDLDSVFISVGDSAGTFCDAGGEHPVSDSAACWLQCAVNSAEYY